MTIDYRQLMLNLKDNGFVSFYPEFKHHTVLQGGFLPDLAGGHAAWYYALCAHGMLKEVEEGAEYDGELDHQSMLNNLVRSVAALYALSTPDMLLRFLPDARLEAVRCGYGWDERVEKPWLDRYVKRDN